MMRPGRTLGKKGFQGKLINESMNSGRAALPLPYAYEPLLCEVVFGQMLRIPAPQFKPIMYFTLMVELCKLMKLVPRAMSACVR